MIVFKAEEPLKPEKIHENILPTSVLASVVLAGIAVPFLPKAIGPLAIAQARRPQPLDDTISEAPPVLNAAASAKLARSRTVAAGQRSTRRAHGSEPSTPTSPSTPNIETIPKRPRPSSKSTRTASGKSKPPLPSHRQASLGEVNGIASASLTDLPGARHLKEGLKSSLSIDSIPRPSLDVLRRHSFDPKDPAPIAVSRAQQTLMLRSHYLKCETAFLSALEGISNRLVALPKPARLSALRAELALIARDLPAEVDIPLLCAPSLVNGNPANSKHHRIVRLNPAEATSLNSAERVPYLLMVEVLREDFDFNPDTPSNQRLLSEMMTEKGSSRRRPFDITSQVKDAEIHINQADEGPDSVFEPLTGDLGSPDLLKDFTDGEATLDTRLISGARPAKSFTPPPNTVNGKLTASHSSSTTLLNEPVSRRSSPGVVKGRSTSKDQASEPTDLSALATHMRTAAQMLAQLDVSSSKRPKQEVENIKAKIIASMQTLEETNFTSDAAPAQTFDSIMAQARASADAPADLIESPEQSMDGGIGPNSSVGAARMENDEITGGVRRTGDRDDPSAATFGEDWKSKKERIRRTSPYGWMKNWDLLSCIVKTGSDLRQELFATQLIRICSKIWEDAQIPVWVKQMRILVTGESSGLIETITNGVSVHSLKRSITLASIAAGTNPRKRFATLVDHFQKAFGESESPAYRAGQEAFARSLAAYSVISYILQLKDRHNGNILIDNAGHIIHIDFGFMLSNSPGSVGFEAAPFKLTQDYVDVLGGPGAPAFELFKGLCKSAFQALRKSAENVIMVVELMSKESKMACFQSGGVATVAALRQRFMLHLSTAEAETFVETDLIAKSLGSYYTRLYDTFQYRTQGIY